MFGGGLWRGGERPTFSAVQPALEPTDMEIRKADPEPPAKPPLRRRSLARAWLAHFFV